MPAKKTPSRPSAAKAPAPGNQPKSKISKESNAGTGRGGRRTNAGRKPGSATIRTREIADKAAELGVTPLEVMLLAMTALVEQAEARKVEGAAEERLKLLIAASGVAKDAAPYMHPRLQAIEHTGRDGADLIPPAAVVGDPAAYYAWFVKQGALKA